MMMASADRRGSRAEEDAGQGVDAADEAAQVEDEFLAPEPAEAQQTRNLRTPEMPSESQIREHKTTHCPYRCWCDECVEAFGRERPHVARDRGSERAIPVIRVDYLFWTARGMVTKTEITPDERQTALTVVAAYCSRSKFFFDEN